MPEATQSPLKILFAAAEAEPFVKVGGLGDVAGSLPRALRALPSEDTGGASIDARLILPFHPVVDREKLNLAKAASFLVKTTAGGIRAEIYETNLEGLPVYLVDGRPVREVKTAYSLDAVKDGDKFVFFCRAVLEFCNRGYFVPHILHANDWHTALLPHLLKIAPEEYPSLSSIRTVLTIHNLPFMGAGIEKSLEKFRVQPSKDTHLPTWAKFIPMPMGISAVDRITAVSPHYHDELFTKEYGCGLQDYLMTIRTKIGGILNGIDTEIWNPAVDPLISQTFSIEDLESREKNRAALINEFGLDPDPSKPLLTFIGRMDVQKGVEILLEGLPMAADSPWQAIIIGSGTLDLEEKTRQLETRFPDRLRAVIKYDAALSHRLYAGADMIMIPSRYEPCGLVQMIAMRYGCIPIASAVGGLVDTISDLPAREDSTGYLYSPAKPEILASAISRAIRNYADQTIWKRMQLNGMSKDFSWNISAREYARLYLSERMP